MIESIDRGLESWLYHRGYMQPEVRRLVANQTWIMLLACAACLPAGLWTPWALHFAAGVALISLNFFSLARFGQGLGRMRSGEAIIGQLVRFYGRLLFTGLALFVLIRWADASAAALLAGVSTVVVNVALWGATRLIGQHAKEA